MGDRPHELTVAGCLPPARSVRAAGGTRRSVRRMVSERRELQSITVERNDAIVTITLRRPQKKNAANDAMWSELGLPGSGKKIWR